jgi:hypothetical protein
MAAGFFKIGKFAFANEFRCVSNMVVVMNKT